MNYKVRTDTTRVASIWGKGGNTFDIPEEAWPSGIRGDDNHAGEKWAKLTGLTVTIKTQTMTTVEPTDES